MKKIKKIGDIVNVSVNPENPNYARLFAIGNDGTYDWGLVIFQDNTINHFPMEYLNTL